MRFAIIENGIVVNVAVSESPLADNWIASEEAEIGLTYANGVFAPVAPDTGLQWAAIRTERNALLAASDWTQLADAPVDEEAWADYRQDLRDITLHSDPFNIQWPVEPS
jgi:hypothetical protein